MDYRKLIDRARKFMPLNGLEVADAIEALMAENARLEKALRGANVDLEDACSLLTKARIDAHAEIHRARETLLNALAPVQQENDK